MSGGLESQNPPALLVGKLEAAFHGDMTRQIWPLDWDCALLPGANRNSAVSKDSSTIPWEAFATGNIPSATVPDQNVDSALDSPRTHGKRAASRPPLREGSCAFGLGLETGG